MTAFSSRLPSARLLVAVQFAVVATLLALCTFLQRFLGGGWSFAVAVFGPAIFGLSTLIVLVWALWPPRRGKLVVLLVALGVDVALTFGSFAIDRAGEWVFFESRRARLDRLAQDIIAYGQIEQMSDGTRSFKELNHQLVAYSPSEVDATSAAERRKRPLEDVLAHDRIAAQRYEEFRRRLRDVKLIEFDVKPGYVAFLYDGLVDNLAGYLVVRPGGAPPPIRSELFGADLIYLEPLGHGWYRFATT
jgi:hypothetical protein